RRCAARNHSQGDRAPAELWFMTETGYGQTSSDDQAVPRPALAVYALAAAWLFLPALQYIGAYERVRAVTMRGASIGPLGTTDLTPIYVLLIAATAIYFVSSMILGRRAGEQAHGK